MIPQYSTSYETEACLGCSKVSTRYLKRQGVSLTADREKQPVQRATQLTCGVTSNNNKVFLISNFSRVLNVVYFLLGYSPASEFRVPTFRITVFHFHRQVVMWRIKFFTQPPAYEDGTECSETSAHEIQTHSSHNHLPMKMEQCSETSAHEIQTHSSHNHLPMKMEQCSETSAHEIQTHSSHNRLPIKMEQGVPKRRHTKSRRILHTTACLCRWNKAFRNVGTRNPDAFFTQPPAYEDGTAFRNVGTRNPGAFFTRPPAYEDGTVFRNVGTRNPDAFFTQPPAYEDGTVFRNVGTRNSDAFFTQPPAYVDGTEWSETSAHEIQTPGNNPEESAQQQWSIFVV